MGTGLRRDATTREQERKYGREPDLHPTDFSWAELRTAIETLAPYLESPIRCSEDCAGATGYMDPIIQATNTVALALEIFILWWSRAAFDLKSQRRSA
jgi:hypothetical protein